MKDIYLTSTFTNQWNVEFNFKIGDALEAKGVTCYLAHRDTDQKGQSHEIFSQDLEGINNASMVLAIALNESPNWGAELGYTYGIKKKILALTDQDHKIPLICNGMITETLRVDNLDAIDIYIDELIEKIMGMVKSPNK